ncbi:MAG: RDD family protein [Chloracidobacterium sp.]|nr:RDD family protein [Chloracidobacterium sp.]
MASISSTALSGGREKVVDFSPSDLRASFSLRCAALFLDYILLLAIPILWLLWGRLLSDTSSNAAPGGLVWFLIIVLFLIDLVLLPLLTARTFGKMVTGLTILKFDGSAIDLATIIKRNIVGYFLTCATLGIGFIVAAFNSTGRTLHDMVAGTVVVQARKTQL